MVPSGATRSVHLALLCAAVGGCSEGVKLAPVSGVITYQGKPVPNASVLFSPEKGPMAFGKTDANGRYTLKTPSVGEGAVLGKHGVSITANQVSGVYSEFSPDGGGTATTKWIIPEKYATSSTSGLSVIVSTEKNDYSFNLP